jgi:hypothetical protein
MGITVKLRKYEADVESGWTPKRVATAVAAGTTIFCAVTVGFLRLPGHMQVASAVAAEGCAGRGSTAGPPVEVRFATRNWTALEHGKVPGAPKALGTDMSAPEWENYEVLKDLKAMAIFEAKALPRNTAEDEDMAQRLFRDTPDTRETQASQDSHKGQEDQQGLDSQDRQDTRESQDSPDGRASPENGEKK